MTKPKDQDVRTRTALHALLDQWIDTVEATTEIRDDGCQHTLTLHGWLDAHSNDDEPLFGFSLVRTVEEPL